MALRLLYMHKQNTKLCKCLFDFTSKKKKVQFDWSDLFSVVHNKRFKDIVLY